MSDVCLVPSGTVAGTSRAETLVSRKAQCLLAIGGDKKVSFLEWLSPLIKFMLSVGVTESAAVFLHNLASFNATYPGKVLAADMNCMFSQIEIIEAWNKCTSVVWKQQIISWTKLGIMSKDLHSQWHSSLTVCMQMTC